MIAPTHALRCLAMAAAIFSVPLRAQGRPQEFRLPSGLRCILVESHDRPLIRMELVTRWEPSLLPPGREGLGGFLGLALEAGGCGPWASRAAFLGALDNQGANYAFQTRLGSFRWSLATDSRSQETAMELLADAVVRPGFDGPLVEGQRQAILKKFASGSPRERGIARFLWSIGDPGTPLPPSAKGLGGIEYQDLLDFRRRVIRPEASTLALYGDLNLTQAKQLVLMHLGIWGPAPDPAPDAAPGSTPGSTDSTQGSSGSTPGSTDSAQGSSGSTLPPGLAEAKDKAGQGRAPEPRLLAVLESGPSAELWIGAPRPAAGTGPAAEALLPILLTRASRIFFGPFETRFLLPPGGRCLLLKAKVAQADRDNLVPGCTAALDGLRRTGFSAEDLDSARSQWLAENAALSLHPAELLRRTLEGRLDPALAQAMAALTVKDVNGALQAWLGPEQIRTLLLGADAMVLKAAEKAGLGPPEILSPEDAKSLLASTPSAPAGQ